MVNGGFYHFKQHGNRPPSGSQHRKWGKMWLLLEKRNDQKLRGKKEEWNGRRTNRHFLMCRRFSLPLSLFLPLWYVSTLFFMWTKNGRLFFVSVFVFVEICHFLFSKYSGYIISEFLYLSTCQFWCAERADSFYCLCLCVCQSSIFDIRNSRHLLLRLSLFLCAHL